MKRYYIRLKTFRGTGELVSRGAWVETNPEETQKKWGCTPFVEVTFSEEEGYRAKLLHPNLSPDLVTTLISILEHCRDPSKPAGESGMALNLNKSTITRESAV